MLIGYRCLENKVSQTLNAYDVLKVIFVFILFFRNDSEKLQVVYFLISTGS